MLANNQRSRLAEETGLSMIRVNANTGSVRFENNTLRDFNGRYALETVTALATPIVVADNDWGGGTGGTTAPFQLVPLNGGTFAIGATAAGDVVLGP